MLNFVKQFIQDEEGATALEYGLLAALMAGAITVAVGALGDGLSNTFQNIANSMENAVNGTATPEPETTPSESQS